MDDRTPLLFHFGVPKPVECRLPDGGGGVGTQRQCVSDIGVINQRITKWEPPSKLQFEMRDTDMYFGRWIDRIHETFELTITERGTRLRRTTDFHLTGVLGPLKSPAIWFGLKNVHRYVFRNWARILAQAAN